MSSVNGSFSGDGDNLKKLLEANTNSYLYAAGKVGVSLDKVNSDLLSATTANENSNELRKLAAEYGLITKAQEKAKVNVSSEAVVLAIKDQHERRSRVLTLISNMMDSLDRTIRGIIDKIGR